MNGGLSTRARRRGLALGVEALEGRVVPATIAVATTADAGPGSLRAAIQQADADPGPDTITFAPGLAGTIVLASAMPDLSNSMTLAGPGASVLTVARNTVAGTPAFRIFTVDAGVEASISGLTISGGRSVRGGGILNAGTLTLADATLSGNVAAHDPGVFPYTIESTSGGGIANDGTMTITHSTVTGNATAGDDGSEDLAGEEGSSSGTGGGIANSGKATIDASTISDNSAFGGNSSAFYGFGSPGIGGGIANSGTLAVTASTFGGNAATGGVSQGIDGDGDGGGIANSGTLTVTASTFGGNTATGGGTYYATADGIGGGIENSGTLTVTASTLGGNSATSEFKGMGGGIANEAGTASVTASTLSGNSATGSPSEGGGISNAGTLTVTDSTLSGNTTRGDHGDGGGIANTGTLTVTASTLSGNSAANSFSNSGGGISNGGTATVIASTLSGNSAAPDFGSTGHFTYGGGIYDTGTLTVVATTLSGNSAYSAGGGIYAASAGGAGTPRAARVLAITSLFDNPAGGNLAPGTGGAFTSLGHNLFSDRPDVPLDRTDLVAVDPLLGPLAANGGPTFTQALLPGSPAIAAGTAIAGVTTDQRGIPRPAGVAPDIGAFQSRGFTLVRTGGDGQRAQVGATFPAPLAVVVSSPFGEPVAGGQVTFSAPPYGPTARLGSRVAPVAADGRAGVTASAAGAVGTYAVDAAAAGAGPVAFALTNTTPPSLALRPATSSGLVGGTQAVTATASDPSGKPLAGIAVTFRVVAGPDAGVASATVRTDAGGRARFTSANTHGPGTDVIAAAATLPGGVVVQAPKATVAWTLPRVALAPTAGSAAAGLTATLTATATTAGGAPLADIPVTFRVVAGPNAGAAGATVRTDAAGRARFTYADTRGPGTDILVAAALVPGGITVDSGRVSRTWIAAAPPAVEELRRYGFHAQPTLLVLTFTGPLDPTRAEDLSNYALVGPVGGRGRGGHPIAISRAIYDASTHTVTLLPARGLNVHDRYRLTIRGTGPAGVAGPSGVLLDGTGDGRPGSDSVITFGRESLAGPASTAAQFQPRP